MSDDDPATAASPIELAKTVVVKVGTRVLTNADGHLDRRRIACLSAGINAIGDSGRRVILVSSGAVAAGVAKLDLATRPTSLAALQATAAVRPNRFDCGLRSVLGDRGTSRSPDFADRRGPSPTQWLFERSQHVDQD